MCRLLCTATDALPSPSCPPPLIRADPLNLGVNKEYLEWYRNAELQNGRWAMLGVAGIIIPAELTRQGVLDVPAWYDAGKVYIESENSIPFSSLLMVQFFLFNFVGEWRGAGGGGAAQARGCLPGALRAQLGGTALERGAGAARHVPGAGLRLRLNTRRLLRPLCAPHLQRSSAGRT